MAAICTNIIHITYYGNDETNIQTSSAIFNELEETFEFVWNADTGSLFDGVPETYSELGFESSWVAPLAFLQELCKKYNVDILGVAFEFSGGHVESFTLFKDSEDEIMPTNHLISFEAENRENIETPPIEGNDDILDQPLRLTDEEILASYQ